MGISTYAVGQLGDITYVELPEVGMKAKQHDLLCTVESVKAASDIYFPVSAVVTAVNTVLDEAPEKLNFSPEEDGWIVEFEIEDPDEVSKLMTAEQYKEYVETLK